MMFSAASKPVSHRTHMSDGKVTWCFTPSQPVRLYQGECQMEKWSNNVKVDKRNCGDIGFFF